MWGALIGAGASLLGGMLDRKSASSQVDQSNAMQREFAQHGIRWKVEDAKAAGVHPLYAIGGSGAAYSPPPIVTGQGSSIAQAGQDIGRAFRAQQSEPERELHDAQMRVLRAQASKDEALARAADSESMRSNQSDQHAIPFPYPSIAASPNWAPNVHERPIIDGQLPSRGVNADGSVKRGHVALEADKVVSGRPGDAGISAGRDHPAYQQYQLGNLPILLPRSEEGPGEALENLSVFTWPFVISANVQRFGRGWLMDLAKQLRPRAGMPMDADYDVVGMYDAVVSALRRSAPRGYPTLRDR